MSTGKDYERRQIQKAATTGDLAASPSADKEPQINRANYSLNRFATRRFLEAYPGRCSYPVEGARQAGASVEQILYLARNAGFDVDAARQDGYSNDQIIDYLARSDETPGDDSEPAGKSGVSAETSDELVAAGQEAAESEDPYQRLNPIAPATTPITPGPFSPEEVTPMSDTYSFSVSRATPPPKPVENRNERRRSEREQAQSRTVDAVEKIAGGLEVLCEPQSWHELRTLKGNNRVAASGYFNDPKLMAEAATRLNQRGDNVYFTLNPVREELSARSLNHVVDWPKHTTTDEQIVFRLLLLIDIDPTRVAGIPASDAEHTAALERAEQIRQWLMEEWNWPAPIMMDSGNGAYLLWRVALDNNDASRQLIKAVLGVLARRFNDAQATIDTGTYNASRIARIPGTLNRKGDSTADRPHRLAKLLFPIRTELEVVTCEQLEQVAGAVDSRAKDKTNGQASASEEFEAVIKAIEARGISVNQDGNGKHFLSECLFDPSHSGGTSVAIIEYATSKVKTYACKHPPCDENGKSKRLWGDVLVKLGLEEKKAVRGFELTKLNDLLKKEFPPDKFIWEGRLVVGTVSIIVAKPKLGKSTLARNIALTLAQGWGVIGVSDDEGRGHLSCAGRTRAGCAGRLATDGRKRGWKRGALRTCRA